MSWTATPFDIISPDSSIPPLCVNGMWRFPGHGCSPLAREVKRHAFRGNDARRTWRASVEKRGAQDEEDSIVTPGLRERKKSRPGLGQAGRNDYFFGDD